MGRVSDLYLELQEYVGDALYAGAANVSDIMEHVKATHPNFVLPYNEEVIENILDDYLGEPENDGQPDEAQEWHDFDPDC